MKRFDTQTIDEYIFQQLELGNPVNAKKMAAHFHISYFHFSRQFKQHFGITFKQYLSACKIEYSQRLLLKGDSVTAAQLNVGFASSGTFSTTFKQYSGLSPKAYARSVIGLGKQFAKTLRNPPAYITYHGFDIHQHPQHHALCINVENIETNAAALTFIGLYPKPMPKGFPVAGVALSQGSRCQIAAIPDGQYHILACQLRLAMNPMHYFDASNTRRAIHAEPVTFPLAKNMQVELTLREYLPSDPPITVNLPKVFFEGVRQQLKKNQ